MENILEHYGVLGMRWGKRRGNIKGSYRERFKRYRSNMDKEIAPVKIGFNHKKLIKGKTLTRDVLEAIGGHLAIGLTASTLAAGPAGPTALALGALGQMAIKGNLAVKLIQRTEQRPNPHYNKKKSEAANKRSEARVTLEKKYGKLEDQMTYGKNTNKEKNKKILKELTDIEKKIKKMNNQIVR